MNKFFAFAFLALCAVANSQVLPLGLPMNVYQTDLIASQIGGGSSSSSAASAAASSSSAANNDIIASRINALNAWPLGLGPVVSPIGPVVGPIGPVVGPLGGSSSSSAAAAAAAASSSAANNAALNAWPVLSGLGPINPWISLPVGPAGPLGPVNPLSGLVGIY